MYNLEQLKMFVLSAKLGSFSACAKKIGKVQSAVSQGIANLEIDLNVQLFDRSTRKPKLTAEGQHLLAFAEATLQQVHELESASIALNREQETQITIVLDDGLQLPSLYATIDRFAQQFPATSLHTFFAASADIADLINHGHADIGLMYSDTSFIKDIELCYIGSVPFVAVVSPEHPLSSFTSLSASQLMLHRQLMIKGLYRNQCQFTPFSPSVWWTNDYRTLKQYVKQGLGWGYLPKHMIGKELTSGQLHCLPVNFDHKPWSIPVERVTPKNRVIGPACSWLTKALTNLLE
ncbi:LysR family transcriptional regulator [Shewanella halifaxensis]|uniref:LysR family transcriptional regulator n=1 Tax=Shewanella halifaxensis TaxID=271098 RepID=UPI000D590065|nr:LysR family transcriptional regulator [Shewanella halifaxensis]